MRAPLTPSQIAVLRTRLTARSAVQPSGCINVQGAALHSGHVQFSIGAAGRNIRVRAHVFAWEMAHAQAVPAGKVIMHTCDNPRCVNPEHLRLGTQADNIYDSIHKGRYNTFGIQKLNAENVREIRQRLSEGQTHRDIARAFGIGRTTVTNIARGASWGHLPSVDTSVPSLTGSAR